MSKPYSNESSIRRVAPFLILLMAAVALVLAAAAALSRLWEVQDTPNWQGISLAGGQAVALETAPQQALDAYLAEKQKAMERYEWIDAEQSLARIPVDAAIRALGTQDGLEPERRQARMMGLED